MALVSPYPSVTTSASMPSGVAGYTKRLAAALCSEGMRVHVLAPTAEGEPALASLDGVTVQRCYRRGAAALPMAALAARRCDAPVVHVQFETFLYGGPTSIPGVAPALAGLRRRRSRPVVTLHQVVDPSMVDRAFTDMHRVRVPPSVARIGLAAVQRSVPALAAATVVHEQPFARVVPGAVVVPHGVDQVATPSPEEARQAKEKLGLAADRLSVLCFGFLAPYKGLEAALQAAALAPEVELVVAGGSHPRLAQTDGYAEDLRRRYGAVAALQRLCPRCAGSHTLRGGRPPPPAVSDGLRDQRPPRVGTRIRDARALLRRTRGLRRRAAEPADERGASGLGCTSAGAGPGTGAARGAGEGDPRPDGRSSLGCRGPPSHRSVRGGDPCPPPSWPARSARETWGMMPSCAPSSARCPSGTSL